MELLFYTLLGFLELYTGLVMLFIMTASALYGAVFLMKLGLHKQNFAHSLLAGLVIWLGMMVLLPTLTNSSISQVVYTTDYLVLFMMSLGYSALIVSLLPAVFRLTQHFRTEQKI